MQAYRSPVLLSRLAIGGLAVLAGCRLLLVITGVGFIFGPAGAIDLGDGDSMSVWNLVSGLIALLLMPVFIYTVVTFLMWLYRIFSNLPSLRSDQMEFTPGWAVGWWFIPLANLIKPYQAVRTAWAESDPDIEVHNEFLTTIQSGAPSFMMLWWALWIIGNVVSNVSSRLDSLAEPGEQAILGYVLILESVIWIVASALAIKVILSITGRHVERHARVDSAVMDQPPPPPPTFDSEVA
jgi:hypothetical protein